jgi:hypothetical protein
MSDDESRLLEEVDFWLRLNNDYLLKHGKQPTRRMQEALFHALDRLRVLRGLDAGEGDDLPDLAQLRPLTETLN